MKLSSISKAYEQNDLPSVVEEGYVILSNKSSTGSSPKWIDESPDWELSVKGGLKHVYRPNPGYFFVGYSSQLPKTEDEVVEGFFDVATEFYNRTGLNFSSLSGNSPALFGWNSQIGPMNVALRSATTTSLQKTIIENSQRKRFFFPGKSSSARVLPLEGNRNRRDMALDALRNLLLRSDDDVLDDETMGVFEESFVKALSSVSRSSLEILKQLIFDDSKIAREVKVEAVKIVGRRAEAGPTGDRAAFLRTTLTHQVASLRDAAAQAMVRLGVENLANDLARQSELESHPLVRKNMMRAAEKLGYGR